MRQDRGKANTVVCFHAHPDDEALLTAGTMARAAAEGRRVVLVVATRGEVGQVDPTFLDRDEALGSRRWAELARSALILGVHRLEWLGYADSGSDPGSERGSIDPTPPPDEVTGASRPDPDLGADADPGPIDGAPAGPVRFVDAPVAQAAARLAAILEEEDAHILVSYDPNGGYGHPDHVRVHQVGQLAAARAGTPVLLEATIDRELLHTGVELARASGYDIPAELSPTQLDQWYTASDEITHQVDVRAQLEAKRAAMEAHASQATADDPSASRSLALFVGLPDDWFALAFGTEWFVQRVPTYVEFVDDLFAVRVAAA